jgi:hypothetical protein
MTRGLGFVFFFFFVWKKEGREGRGEVWMEEDIYFKSNENRRKLVKVSSRLDFII